MFEDFEPGQEFAALEDEVDDADLPEGDEDELEDDDLDEDEVEEEI